ncbi:caspase family protein [bacterium SCSIO 12741]|nr:caspase family protein [bacterium SCSIO 12741]
MHKNFTQKTLSVGINKYEFTSSLSCCVNDATEVAHLLKRHANGDVNFDDVVLKKNSRKEKVEYALDNLFSDVRGCNHVLFFFSGHGYRTENDVYLVCRDSSLEDPGISLVQLMNRINKSSIPSITVILDCCHAGFIGDTEKNSNPMNGSFPVSCIRENVTLLAATTGPDVAGEDRIHGLFTKALLYGLQGAAADLFGQITPASLYALADSYFTAGQQRPLFKSNSTNLNTLRLGHAILDHQSIRELKNKRFHLERKDPVQLYPHEVCIDLKKTDKIQRFEQLIQYQRAGLIECPNNNSIYLSALLKRPYQLSALGNFYLELHNHEKI